MRDFQKFHGIPTVLARLFRVKGLVCLKLFLGKFYFTHIRVHYYHHNLSRPGNDPRSLPYKANALPAEPQRLSPIPTGFEIYITLNKIIEISELSVSVQNLTVISCSLVEVVWRDDRTSLQKPRKHHKPNVKLSIIYAKFKLCQQ